MNRTKYTKHVNRVVTVTRVQPVTRVDLRNPLIAASRDPAPDTQNVAQVRTLSTRTITTAKTIQVNHRPTSGTCGRCR